MPDNIISFSDYLKKRNKPLQVDPGFIEALGDDIKNRPELLELDFGHFSVWAHPCKSKTCRWSTK